MIGSDPHNAFVLGDAVYGRLDTGGSSLALPAADDDTRLLVATDSGCVRWMTTAERPDDFPFMAWLGSELVEVSAIAGDLSPQAFTVVRLSGQAWPAGAGVRVATAEVPS